MGYGLEVEMIREAHDLDLLTCPYVFNPDEARAMAEAGADVLVPHMGLTTKGTIGAQTAMTPGRGGASACRPCATPPSRSTPTSWCSATAAPSPSRRTRTTSSSTPTGIVGFFGASSIERLSVEAAIEEQARRFKQIDIGY